MTRRPLRAALLTLVLVLTGQAAIARSEPSVLRVGVVEGSPPCSERSDGVWRGMAVSLWSEVAALENLAFQLSVWPSTQELLEATREHRVDVGVGCINVSPERLSRYTFSLPFQEDGLAVLVLRSPLVLGHAFLAALLSRELLLLLGGFLVAIGLLTGLIWRMERYGLRPETERLGRLRSLSKLFQVLATGPGGNTIVETVRGNAVVITAYLIRIVAASLLVGVLTVRVVDDTQGKARGAINSLEDLRGLRVAVRRGSVSQALINGLNSQAPSAGTIQPVLISAIDQALPALESRRADAVLADDLQLAWLVRSSTSRGRLPILSIRGIRPESQAFAVSPQLPRDTAERIDRAISVLKRSGRVSELRRQAIESDRGPADASSGATGTRTSSASAARTDAGSTGRTPGQSPEPAEASAPASPSGSAPSDSSR